MKVTSGSLCITNNYMVSLRDLKMNEGKYRQLKRLGCTLFSR